MHAEQPSASALRGQPFDSRSLAQDKGPDEHPIGLLATQRNGGATKPVGARIAGERRQLAANPRTRREAEIEQAAAREAAKRRIERHDVGSGAGGRSEE